MYASYHKVADDVGRQRLIDVLGGDVDEPPTIDNTPRIVLVASDFRPEVTTTVLWLIENFDVDIRCVRLRPFVVGDTILVSSDLLIPLPVAEEYRLGVQRKRKEVERENEQKARAGRLLPRLFEAGAIQIGQTLFFRKDAVPTGSSPGWDENEKPYRATIATDEGIRTLEWEDPTNSETRIESPSLLAARVLHYLGVRDGEISSNGINGMHYWTIDGEIAFVTWEQRSEYSTGRAAPSTGLHCIACAPTFPEGNGRHTVTSPTRSGSQAPPSPWQA